MSRTIKKAPAAAKPAKPEAGKKKPEAVSKPAMPKKAAAKTGAAKKNAKAAAPAPKPEYVSSFSVGKKVTHPVFGEGKVTAVDRDQLSIKFAAFEKVVLDSFVKPSAKN